MVVEGLSAVAARIAQINKQISALTPSHGFAAQLATAMGSTTGSSASAAALKLNADGVPVDLVKYGNGKVPASALESIGRGSHRLWSPAADSFRAMTDAARRDGVSIGVTDSYRSFGEQVDLARRKGLYSQGGLAARPGTSDHGWGLSLDLDLDPRAQSWMRQHAREYGFTENVPREPWHWTFQPQG